MNSITITTTTNKIQKQIVREGKANSYSDFTNNFSCIHFFPSTTWKVLLFSMFNGTHLTSYFQSCFTNLAHALTFLQYFTLTLREIKFTNRSFEEFVEKCVLKELERSEKR